MKPEAAKFRRTKLACYYSYLATASVFSLPALLFVTFREMYGISYTLLGTLVLVNFCTQLTIDLIFSFFTRFFNLKKTLRTMPLLTSLGLFTYAIVPMLFPEHAYAGLLTGTVIFSISAGLCEVLISPTVAAIPSDTPDRDMSALHSLYAYGVVTVILISTIFLKIFGTHNWMYLTMFWAVLPIFSFILFSLSPMPDVEVTHDSSTGSGSKRTFGMALCVLCIFLGSAAENTMTNWISGYMENALGISKVLGDVLGMALFAMLLGLTRTWYAKYGKNITNFLLVSMTGAVICYLVAALSKSPLVSMIACILTGPCTSMLWPGTLILMEEKFPHPGVIAYALMAAGGDFGGSVAPQMLGAVVDAVAASGWAASLAPTLSLTAEQLGMKVGMLTAAAFPVLGVAVLLYIRRYFKNHTAA